MASSGQSRAPPTPLSEQFANSVPHILASLRALEEKESAQQLEIDRLKQEIDVLRLKASEQHDLDVNKMEQRVRHYEELKSLAESCTLVAQGVKLIKEKISAQQLEIDRLKLENLSLKGSVPHDGDRERTITKRGQPASAPGVKRTAGKTLHLAMKNLQLDRPAQ